MKTKNLIKSLEKVGLKVERFQEERYDLFEKKRVLSTPEYTARNEKNKISFYDENGSVTCCQVMGVKQNNDSQSDYFPGYFANTIKSALAGMGY